MSQEDLYTSMGTASPNTLDKSNNGTPTLRRPLSRLFSAEPSTSTNSPNEPQISRLSRSQTMMHPTGSGRPTTPTSPYPSRSPTSTLSPSKRIHGSIDNSDFSAAGLPGHSHTLAYPERSKTTKIKTGPGIYGKNLWEDEDEYVDTGGKPSTRPISPSGGPASRRINQQRKMNTVKLPKSPFIEDDYADMTGHMNDESGMVELRNQHQYKSMKSRRPPDFKADFSEVRHESFDGSPTAPARNQSVSSQKSSSQSPNIFKRSDTTPVLHTQGDLQMKDFQSTVKLPNHSTSTLSEVDGSTAYQPGTGAVRGNPPSTSEFSERHDSLKKESVKKSTSIGQSAKAQLAVPSPARSVDTVTTVLPASTPGTPSITFQNGSSNATEAKVAIVIEETAPTSPMYARGIKEERDLQRTKPEGIIFEEPTANRHQRCLTIILIALCVILTIALIVAVVVLVLRINDQQNEISNLKDLLNTPSTTGALPLTEASISNTTSENPTTQFIEITTAETMTYVDTSRPVVTDESVITTSGSADIFNSTDSSTSWSTTAGEETTVFDNSTMA